MDSNDLWDLESAMQVLSHDTVDSKLWAQAVEWLLLNGPPEIRRLLLNASTTATSSSFPGLKPSHFTPDGQPCYDIGELAGSLGINEAEAKQILEKKQKQHQLLQLFTTEKTGTVH